ncbi:MAG TPA: hypothetical protein VKR58_15145 [Aquella sp.]|nr:hypothetical protein [Aquella sp.]
MTIQSQFNEEAINMLPLVKEEIAKAGKFESCQMTNKTLYAAINNHQALCDMSESDLQEFQNDLLEIFKFNGWTN